MDYIFIIKFFKNSIKNSFKNFNATLIVGLLFLLSFLFFNTNVYIGLCLLSLSVLIDFLELKIPLKVLILVLAISGIKLLVFILKEPYYYNSFLLGFSLIYCLLFIYFNLSIDKHHEEKFLYSTMTTYLLLIFIILMFNLLIHYFLFNSDVNFKFPLENKIYKSVLGIFIYLFHLMFLGNVPTYKTEIFLNITIYYVKTQLYYLIKTIITPFLIFYIVTMYIYFISAFITRAIPKGMVSNLVIWFSFLILFITLYMRIRENSFQELEKTYKYILFFMLPVQVFLFYAIMVRVFQYGITQPRYLGIMSLLFNIISYVLLLKMKDFKLNYICLEAIIFVFIYFISPINAVKIEYKSQTQRLENLSMNHLNAATYNEGRNIIKFLSAKYPIPNLEKNFYELEFDLKSDDLNDLNDLNISFEEKQILKLNNLKNDNDRILYPIIKGETNLNFDISDVKVIMLLENSKLNRQKKHNLFIEEVLYEMEINTNNNGEYLKIKQDKEVILEIDLYELFALTVKSLSNSDISLIETPELVTLEENGKTFKLYITDLSLTPKYSKNSSENWSPYLYRCYLAF